MFPYLDLKGFRQRAQMPVGEIDYVETDSPGYTAQRIASWSSYINGRLRKRYGNAATNTSSVVTGLGTSAVVTTISQNGGNSLPLGQAAPEFLAAGTAPPLVTLSGRPTLGSVAIVIQIVGAGPLGTASFKFSTDGGAVFSSPQTTAASVPLGFGLTANFSTGAYATDNIYSAATPVPEVVLGWLTTLVMVDIYRKRGANFAGDPALESLREDMKQALADLKEAADSKDGLFDLPSNEDADSAVTTGGPLGYSETSPYVGFDIEASNAAGEDYNVVTNDLTTRGPIL